MNGINCMLKQLSPSRVRNPVHDVREPESNATKENIDYLRCLHLSEALSFGMLVTDADGDSVYANAAYQYLAGRSAKDLHGSHWAIIFHPADRSDIVQRWRYSMEKQTYFVAKARLTQPGGKVIWVNISIVSLNDSQPVRGYLHTIENIFEQTEIPGRHNPLGLVKKTQPPLDEKSETIHLGPARAQSDNIFQGISFLNNSGG